MSRCCYVENCFHKTKHSIIEVFQAGNIRCNIFYTQYKKEEKFRFTVKWFLLYRIGAPSSNTDFHTSSERLNIKQSRELLNAITYQVIFVESYSCFSYLSVMLWMYMRITVCVLSPRGKNLISSLSSLGDLIYVLLNLPSIGA